MTDETVQPQTKTLSDAHSAHSATLFPWRIDIQMLSTKFCIATETSHGYQYIDKFDFILVYNEERKKMDWMMKMKPNYFHFHFLKYCFGLRFR